MQFRPLTDTFGAEMPGLDVRALSDDAFNTLYQVWLEHLVLVIPGQSLTDQELQDFSKRFGPLEDLPFGNVPEEVKARHPHRHVLPLSNIIEDGKPLGGLGNGEAAWHSDMTYVPHPPTASILYGVEIPKDGGDTWFANQIAALEALPEDLRAKVQAHAVKHDATHSSIGKLRRGYEEESDVREIPGQVHPLIRQHDETSREALYLGRRDYAYVDGLPVEESEALLDALWDIAALPEHCLRHTWTPGDLVIWDNRSVLHRRDSFPNNQRRMMRRCQVLAR